MFFSGDPSSTRKRVDLGGRSSKERDRQKLLEQTRLERNRRFRQRQQSYAALKIQKCFRGRKIVEAERCDVRKRFFLTFGDHCQNVDRQCFGPDSDFLRQLLFFFNPKNTVDFSALVETCRLLQKFIQENGDVVSLVSGIEYSSERALVNYRVKRFVFACIHAIHENRIQLRDQLITSANHGAPANLLLEAAQLLIDYRLPWACHTVSYLLGRNVLLMFRNIIVTLKPVNIPLPSVDASSLEHILAIVISHVGQGSCVCQNMETQWSFTSQILTIPFLWRLFPNLKEIFVTRGVIRHYFHQMALCVKDRKNLVFNDLPKQFPGYACLLGNVLEVAGVSFIQPEAYDMAVDFTTVATSLLEALPSIRPSNEGNKQNGTVEDDEMVSGDEHGEEALHGDIELQIYNAIDSHFLLQLTNVLLGGISLPDKSCTGVPSSKEVAAVAAACAFLHVTFNILPLERIMTVLAYRTGLVPVLWNFMKRCHENNIWSSLSSQSAYLPEDAPGWLLPLAVFCPVYKHMLMIVDNEEFYDQEKPLPLDDIRSLIVILRQALWQLMWFNPVAPCNFSKSSSTIKAMKQQPLEFLQHKVCVTTSELLSQLQDWNNRRQFTPPSDFHADGVNEYFINQAMTENTKANDILKLAPFLVPFTSRAKIFSSQLAAVKERHTHHDAFSRIRFRVRRDRILEDAFGQLNALSEENLRGQIRITFINEFGVEEAGIDGGGIFKDFMESVTRAAFDVQYGLFKETSDHLLYPNPGSGLVHEMHHQLFYFLGTVLAKAMFEGILVDIPFATFFLSKLKQKYNYLNDLPSLDPELYRHLIFLKHYEGDISDLELYFVIVNNEYGEQTEEELLPGGKNVRVTNENVITFIHLVANHRLNSQIRQQSSHFSRGFQQLIQKEWIDMFNEHELQLLISGSVDGFDIDDLRANTNYAGGYRAEHYVIQMFWEVIKHFSLEDQRKFLKFVTGCSRGPLLGFKNLEPLFCIQRAAGSASEEAVDRLPTAATCMNLLKLPPYKSKEQMEQKLLYAINAAAGFDLS